MKKSIINVTLLLLLMSACKKQDEFLDKVPNQSLAVPSTLKDCESLLGDETVFNAYSDPALGYLSTDDFYVADADWAQDVDVARNTFIFAKDIYAGTLSYNDWLQPYEQVYYSNVVLETLQKIALSPANLQEYNAVKGAALFFRAYAFYNLVQTYAMPFDTLSSKSDAGIPLKLSSAVDQKETRATVSNCYAQIITDLKTSLVLLPIQPSRITQPSQWSANAMLARIYLALSDYRNAYQYANNCLMQNGALTDYNTLTPLRNTINTSYLPEDIFHTSQNGYFIGLSRARVDSILYAAYDGNDLRKTVFFRRNSSNNLVFRGTYDVYNGNRFSGVATDEIYLIRSECNARSGNTSNAMNDLNTLLSNRYITGTYTPYIVADPDSALGLILKERRKELVFRGALRWTDLRRFNKDPHQQITVTHIINGTTYTLPPNDPRYAMSIPDQEIQLTGIPQNPR